MNNIENISELLAQEVTRRQFLAQIGMGFLAIIGVAGMLKNLQSVFPQKKNQPSGKVGAYGWSGYTGIPQR